MATNYLLGYGQRLMTPLPHPGIKPPTKWMPYDFDRAKNRVVQKLTRIGNEVSAIEEKYRPSGESVALFTLHPTFLAKTHFPSHLFSEFKLRNVGSRARMMIPEEQKKSAHGKPELASELFVAGSTAVLAKLSETISEISEASPAALDVRKIEDVRLADARSKIRLAEYQDETCTYWEVVLHASANQNAIVSSFSRLVAAMGGAADTARRVYVGGLCFLPVRIDFDALVEVSQFQLMRVARGMPRFRTVKREIGSRLVFDCDLPREAAIAPEVRAVIFDGGPVSVRGLGRWVTNSESPGIGGEVEDYRDHAIGVTSAFLFGPLEKGKPLPRPYCNVEVVRVLDEGTAGEGDDYFDVHKRVVDGIKARNPDFVNLSIGPDVPVDDDEPHLWTASLDPLLREKKTLAFTAVGNNGEMDWDSGNARVQAPSDLVNAFVIGSCNTLRDDWHRSPHSSVGPGRSPGWVRPEALALGGDNREPYFVLGPATGTAVPVIGTSYASPTAMRIGAGIRAYLGPVMGPLAIKALMINRTDPRGKRDVREVGWGRLSHNVEELITCHDSAATIIFQDDLEAGQWMRAPIPLPNEPLPGKVYITATFCYMCETDPEHPINYTRAGLRLRFRPHEDRRDTPKQKRANSRSLFSGRRVLGQTEHDWRFKSFEWETAMHLKYSPDGADIKAPAFEIHYNARKAGEATSAAGPIPFALVVTVRSKKVRDLYNRIASQYRTILEAIKPIHLPVQLPAGESPSARRRQRD